VFASAHPKVFVAGADLKRMSDESFTPAQVAERVDRAQAAFLRIERLGKPTVAAIEGYALGGGCELVLSMDFRFMARGEGRIGLPEASLGLMPAAGGTQRLPRLIGRTRAAELMMLARRLDADEADRIGLVTACDDARAAALAHAVQLAAMPASSLRWIKTCLNQGYDGDLVTGMGVERAAAMEAFASEDAREGVAAFREKRTPRFNG
jgi:enoyl-CoA hydratase/carnithine racemase